MVKGILLVAVVSSCAFACSVGAPAGQDLWASSSGTTPTPSPSPTPVPPPCRDDLGCGEDESAYGTVTECTSSGAQRCRLVSPRCGGSSYYCGTATAECLAYPSCQSDEIEVTKCSSGATCTVRTECGTSIICQRRVSDCDAYPSCDPGDIETTDVSVCKQTNVDCYSRTMCGSTVTCINVK